MCFVPKQKSHLPSVSLLIWKIPPNKIPPFEKISFSCFTHNFSQFELNCSRIYILAINKIFFNIVVGINNKLMVEFDLFFSGILLNFLKSVFTNTFWLNRTVYRKTLIVKA